MHSAMLLNDGNGNRVSCNLPPDNGLLSLKQQGSSYYWVLDGGFIANRSLIAAIDEFANHACFTRCNSDSNCVASFATGTTSSAHEAYLCYNFYHSDTVNQWEHYCGTSAVNCLKGSGTAQIWSAMCP